MGKINDFFVHTISCTESKLWLSRAMWKMCISVCVCIVYVKSLSLVSCEWRICSKCTSLCITWKCCWYSHVVKANVKEVFFFLPHALLRDASGIRVFSMSNYRFLRRRRVHLTFMNPTCTVSSSYALTVLTAESSTLRSLRCRIIFQPFSTWNTFNLQRQMRNSYELCVNYPLRVSSACSDLIQCRPRRISPFGTKSE